MSDQQGSDRERSDQPPAAEQPGQAPQPPPWPTLGANWKDAPEPSPPPKVKEAPRSTGEEWFSSWEQPSQVPAAWEQESPHQPGARVSNAEARNWAIAAHLSGLLGLITAVPLFNWVGPLVVWLLKRDDHPYIAEQAREALNFNLSMTLYFIIGGMASLAMIFLSFVIGFFGFLMIPVMMVLWVLWVVFTVVATAKASAGEPYRYPLTMRMVS